MFNKKDTAVKPKEQPVSAGDVRNIIGKGTIITGNIETVGNIRLDGKLKGNLRAESKVALGIGSKVDGDIFAQNAEIEGEVIGTIRIDEMLVLKPTAVVTGDIYAMRLVVEAGAVFNGSCKMGENLKNTSISSKIGESPKAPKI